MFEALNAVIETHADSPWLLPLVLIVCILDGVLPPAPAESVLVALAAVAAAEGQPNIWALIAVAALGGFLGDNLTYTVGKLSRLGRFQGSERPRVRSFFLWVARMLLRHGAMIIIVCRFIPGGRQMVNLTAGAMEFPRRRFMLFDSIAVTAWAGYNVGIGALAGAWLEDQPLLGMAAALVLALLLGWVAERAAALWRARTEKEVPAPAT